MLKERYAYLTFRNQNLTTLELAEIVKLRHERENGFLWSARLATGLFGLTTCTSGNCGPKGMNEVILAAGDEGLGFLIQSGFIPCPTCHPENIPGFYKAATGAITAGYSFSDPESFANKNILGFDSRRVNWEIILPQLTTTPNRLYVPAALSQTELISLKNRFAALGHKLPPVGYYDRNAPGHFFEYQIP